MVNGEWIKVRGWDDLPVGEWLVRVDSERSQYHVARVDDRGEGRIVVVAGRFSWDMSPLLAYSEFKTLD